VDISEQDCKTAATCENRTRIPGAAPNDGYLLFLVTGEPAESFVCYHGGHILALPYSPLCREARTMSTLLTCHPAALAVATFLSFAQPDIVKRPVQFGKGTSGATLKGSLTGDQTVDCTLHAAAG
jgi:hypothetical protein